MKHVMSVSLGSSERNKSLQVRFLDEDFLIERLGTDGDLNRAIELVREYDGKVDAFGIGGTDLYIVAGGRRYVLRDAAQLVKAVHQSPIVDGSGLKHTLERRVIGYLEKEDILHFKGKRVLQVCGVDRFGMAEASVDAGADIIFGDVMFGLGLPIPIRGLGGLSLAAKLACPIVTRVPIKYFYPTGSNQKERKPKYVKYFQWAEIISGDFHFIKRYMPSELPGKVILTNTVTAEDVKELEQSGISMLITTTPDIGGRSFGTNVIEALLVAFSGSRPEDLTPDDYNDLLDRLGFKPRIERFTI